MHSLILFSTLRHLPFLSSWHSKYSWSWLAYCPDLSQFENNKPMHAHVAQYFFCTYSGWLMKIVSNNYIILNYMHAKAWKHPGIAVIHNTTGKKNKFLIKVMVILNKWNFEYVSLRHSRFYELFSQFFFFFFHKNKANCYIWQYRSNWLHKCKWL